MVDNTFIQIWDELVNYGIATEDELSLACYLCGSSVETLNKVLCIRTGNRNLSQFLEEIDEG